MQAKIDGTEKSTGYVDLALENARLRGDLLTVARRLSHDLRTPLGGIISSGEAMKEILTETDPSSIPLVVSLLESAEEQAQLIKRASFVLKATAQPLPPVPMVMAEAVVPALQRLELKTFTRGAAITQPTCWPDINGVASWLEVIWGNLVGNSLRHAQVDPLHIELGWEKVDQQYCFFVSDNGRGVPGPRQTRLFQPFEQLHEPDAAPGFGLAIVHRLVELQGGSCGYKANPAGGACFSFVLP